MNNALTLSIVTGLMSGGLIGALVAVYTAHKKVPVERDSIIVTGAETAVLALERTLQAETRRADRAEAQVIQRDEQIESLRKRLDLLQAALDEARQELAAILKAN